MTVRAATAGRFTITVPGEPRGKGRPRFSRRNGAAYTPADTVSAEEQIRGVWHRAGEPRLEGPLLIDVVAVFRRPANHWNRKGFLTAAGERQPFPCKTPDADNVLKLVEDALNAHAWADDKQIVVAHVSKRWATRHEEPHVQLTAQEWPS